MPYRYMYCPINNTYNNICDNRYTFNVGVVMNLVNSVRSFKYPYPLFGRGEKNRLPISHSKVSPYYWWWEFLRRNDDYRKCCENGGKGKLAPLYADFGDVYELEFRLWWGRLKRGAYLFGENEITDRIQTFASVEKCAEHLQNPSILLAAIPINTPKSKLIKSFKVLLKKNHKTQKGRPKVVSNSKYPFCAVPNSLALEQTLTVYDAWKESLKKGERKTLADIGIELRLVKEFLPNAKDTPKEIATKRNKMSATVSRYISDAQAIIANTSLGRFPDKSRPKATKKVSHVSTPKMEIYRYWKKRVKSNPKIALADIGFELKLGKPSWLPQPSDTEDTIKAKRNKMSATVSRYIKNAHSLVANLEHARNNNKTTRSLPSDKRK
jgi:hypothetical protein